MNQLLAILVGVGIGYVGAKTMGPGEDEYEDDEEYDGSEDDEEEPDDEPEGDES